MRLKNFLKLVFSIAICQIVGIGGAFFTSPAVSSVWYKSLAKPFLNPPSWIFSPVWITLYVLMGISLYLVLKYRSLVVLFFVHLLFNGLWSIVFFGLKNPFLAFLNLVVLWILILILIFRFYKVRKVAGLLLIPYLIWVSFAGYLNYSFWILN
ncbi:MAG: TspO/MBR family protein [Patescibacteria group bacterium]